MPGVPAWSSILYGVTPPAIGHIAAGKVWRHVEDPTPISCRSGKRALSAEREREAVERKRRSGLSFVRIAAEFGVSPNTIRDAYIRATELSP
jgi:hypothetical protein